MKYLHTMVRVKDLEASIAFFALLGLKKTRLGRQVPAFGDQPGHDFAQRGDVILGLDSAELQQSMPLWPFLRSTRSGPARCRFPPGLP